MTPHLLVAVMRICSSNCVTPARCNTKGRGTTLRFLAPCRLIKLAENTTIVLFCVFHAELLQNWRQLLMFNSTKLLIPKASPAHDTLENGKLLFFSSLISHHVVWVLASDTLSCPNPPCTCHGDYTPRGSVCIIRLSTIHRYRSNLPPFCSTVASEITSDLPLPGATSLLMNRLNVIRPPAKSELKHNLARSLKLLL